MREIKPFKTSSVTKEPIIRQLTPIKKVDSPKKTEKPKSIAVSVPRIKAAKPIKTKYPKKDEA